jgi:hypothetical protein
MITMSCNIEGCNNKDVETVMFENNDGFSIVNTCTFHLREYRSDRILGKPINLENIAVQQLYN